MPNDFDRDFDKSFSRVRRGAIGAAILIAALQLTFIGAIIWGIVKLVIHFTA